MHAGTEQSARRSLLLAARAVKVLIVEQLLIPVLILIAGNWSLDDATTIAGMLLVFFGIPALIYGVLCFALMREKFWAAVALTALVSLHTLPYLGIVVLMFSNLTPSPWPVIVMIAIMIPMGTCIVLLGQSLASFNGLPGRSADGFQVVLPIDGDRKNNPAQSRSGAAESTAVPTACPSLAGPLAGPDGPDAVRERTG